MHLHLRTKIINDEGSKAIVPVFYKDCGTLALEEPFYKRNDSKQRQSRIVEKIAKTQHYTCRKKIV